VQEGGNIQATPKYNGLGDRIFLIKEILTFWGYKLKYSIRLFPKSVVLEGTSFSIPELSELRVGLYFAKD
jgi:hypothetical protein